ncbi:response regulator transcription factor [Aerococcus suis]|uniref:Two component transcriptional regulator, LuxR family n=1 Tax=Aerococcus suis TaxID=371602 RepID=A0A1W1Y7C7_9LACT|nr:response regulator transcription factor [Aerococcus suis]MCI7240272.1 response regulator transcription factor [Aerococcus suis]MDD7758365.1 response regulator transcription factor [Aerococcus suis]MDY4646959.1 response regulator transcription factor [Aerococcus suis]SMC31648.1 two component transcriptional regulator, LuxR family [Aerococcus suis]
MIRVLIVDDHEMVRLGVSTYLGTQQDIEVVAQASNGEEGYHKAIKYRPDVIVMDLVMDGCDGITASKNILAEWPEAKILIVTSFLDDEKVYPAIEAGAYGYILKTSSAAEIAQAIRKTANDEQVIAPKVSEKLRHHELEQSRHYLHDDLTKREFEVLQLVAKGKSNSEIASELFISLKTVKTHVSNILSKLQVEDRTQATIYAYQHQLIE